MTFNGFVRKQQTISDLRWKPNSYLIKLMEVLDWVLSQIKMVDRGVGLQCVSSVMIKRVGVRGRGGAISGSYYLECRVEKKIFSHDISQMTVFHNCHGAACT